MKRNLILLTILLAALSALSAEYYVDASRPDDSGAATNWATAKKNIQTAVNLTQNGDTIWVTNGTYVLSAEISVTNAITVQSVNGPEVTIVDGNNSNRCINLAKNCLVSGFTITGGWVFYEYEITSGGGVYCADASSLVSNCVISGNIVVSDWQIGNGGGMYGGTAYNCIFSGNMVWGNYSYGGGLCDGAAYGCVFSNNSANRGGGMSGGIASNCTFLGNLAEGGFPMYGGYPCGGGGMSDGTAYNCTFRNNAANWGGGGMENGAAYNCLFMKNSGVYGGGMSSGAAYGCLFNANDSNLQGGGGMSYSTSYNCTLVNNSGGGMYHCTAHNSIIWYNQNEGGSYTDLYPIAAVYNSCSADLIHGENCNITNTPLFMDAEIGDFRLQSNSPCINWGNNLVVSNATDLDGNPRIVEGVVDMGAYEYQGTIGLADSDADGIADDWERQHGGNQNPDGICSNGFNTIREAYIAGLDPNDPQSRFRTSFLPDGVLQWNSVSGRIYSIYWSTNLLNGFQPLVTNIPWTAAYNVRKADGAGFYKIHVQLAP